MDLQDSGPFSPIEAFFLQFRRRGVKEEDGARREDRRE